MSNNKYIINKDSLTGIADAVRDKLGVGKATTDPQTGDIVYPEGKGYYIENEDVEVIAVPNGSGNAYGRGTSSSPAYTEKQIIEISSSVYSQKIEKPFYQLEIQGCFYTTLDYNTLGNANLSLQTSYSDSSRIELQNDNTILQKVTKNFDSAQNRLYIRLIMIVNTYNSEAYYYTRFKVLLKDENGIPIKLISSGFPYKSYTIETVPGVKKPIPYSVADITNNIEDYWNIPEGSLNISANGTYDVTNKAEAVVNVPNPSTGSLDINANGTYDVTEKASAVVNVPNPSTGELNINANGIYDVTDKASANVYIQPPNLQTKQSVISSNGSQIILPDSGYDALNEVDLVVQVPNPSTGSLTINANGTYDVTEKASAIVSVSPSLQTKTTTISQNGSQTITPDSNYDGLSSVNLTISVPNPSTGSLEITENGTYDVTDKASAIVNVPSSGGLPPFVVPTVKVKVPRWDVPGWSDFSNIFSTQEEMLEHLIDILPDKNQITGDIGGSWINAPVFKDEYGRWIPLKMMGVTLPSSFNIGSSWASLGLTKAYIQYLYDNNLAFGCSSVTNYITSGGVWYLIFDRYIIGCLENYVGLHSNYSRVLYTEA